MQNTTAPEHIIENNASSNTKVYYDGACPLCRAEIGYYSNQDGADQIDFVNVADPSTILSGELDRATALKRFHIQTSAGKYLSGAEAFVYIWQQLPRWRWVARLARLPGVLMLLEAAYRAFLTIRPHLSRVAGRVLGNRHSMTE